MCSTGWLGYLDHALAGTELVADVTGADDVEHQRR